MSNLYQDAILDAKALRASAMANAKAALEEAFEPKIQEMISKKLAEEADDKMEGIEEELALETEGEAIEEAPVEETADINEAELDEILNQLEELETQNEAPLNEAEGEEEGEEEEAEEAGEGEEAAEEMVDDETKVIDITLGDLKQVLQSVMAGQAELGGEMPAEEPTADSEAEADIDLDEILDELAAEGLEEDATSVQKTAQSPSGALPGTYEEELKETINEMDPAATLGMAAAGAAGVVGLSALIAKIQDYYKKNPKATGAAVMNALEKVGTGAAAGARNARPTTGAPNEEKMHDMEEAKHKKEDELDEAKATIETLRKDLQEVNLLNAKYLYMNKLFKSKSLTEAQKVKVINALDRATNVKEVKHTYETLKESFETKKQAIKESIGFASKPAGVAPKANIMEADQFISRWQKLAGIK